MADNSNLQSLLKWSLSHCDGERAQQIAPLSAERKEFLKAALAHVSETSVSLTSQLKQLREQLLHRETAERVAALRELHSIFDFNPGTAESVTHLDFVMPLLNCLESGDLEEEVHAALVLTSVMPNNVAVQSAFFERDLHSIMLPKLAAVPREPATELEWRHRKLIIAVYSALVRNFPRAEAVFRAQNGPKLVQQYLNCAAAQTRAKAEFLMQYLDSAEQP